ncbi:MAG: ABC-F family ATP-binding cassette domain-containing protein [Phycisphaerales bacterium]|nr:ABC-F family ATP-binding cassette domain-containing protein [Phycisphaerales bacterium]
MSVLAATNIRVVYGSRIILDGVSISIEPNERIGVVGRNGAGKSTLLKVMAGLIKPDEGFISLQRGSRAGYLHQDPILEPTDTLREAAERAFEKLHDLHEEQHKIYDKMATATPEQLEKLMRKQEEIERQIDAMGGYAIDHKIDQILHGLGFTDAQFTIPVSGLSGGQKGRLALAKLLLEEPDVLLLDEPTNHLDIDGRLWLEQFLREEYKGAVVVISHDRYLLDNVVDRIIETEQCRLIDYPGNYATFVELRAERRMAMARAFENQQKKFDKEEQFVLKYKAGQRAKEARGRATKLARARRDNQLERPVELANFKMELPKAERSGDMVFAANGLSKQYTNDNGEPKVLFHDLSVKISRGERWAIIGPNGAGKTTLVRCLLGQIDIDNGTSKLGSNLKIGYYSQNHAGLDPGKIVYRYLQDIIAKEVPGVQMSEQQARNLAGAFLFSGDEQQRELGTLSGGERSRAVLAGLISSAKNLLILDEPTNHLDISSAERLEDCLSVEGGYEGTLILISHDRALIDSTCDHLVVLDGKGNAEIFHGGYTEWHEKHQERAKEIASAEAEAKRRREDAEKARNRAAEDKKKQQQQKKPASSPSGPLSKLERMKTEQIETRIEQIQSRIRQIDEQMGDVWSNPTKAQKLGDERSALSSELEPLEFEWSRRAEEAME